MELIIVGVTFVIVVVLVTTAKKRHHCDHTTVANRNKTLQTAKSRTARVERQDAFQTAKVEHVIDGDTVIVSSSWRKLRIRLDAIDCPEDGQHWGDIAKYGLIKMIGGRKIQLEEHCIDKYGRTVATIYVHQGKDTGWINVNARMVTLGHAWVMRQFYNHLSKERQNELNSLERWAKTKKVGLWKTDNPVPPWKWREDAQS